MESKQIRKEVTRYSGMSLNAVVYLAKLTNHVDKAKQKEVWKELFYRYFDLGRQFNLYRVLKGEHIYFGFSIEYELVKEKVDIPASHAEDFINNLIDFMKYIEDVVSKSKGELEFSSKIHELAGLKSLMEKVREAKIKDNNVKQQINLFIDKINVHREEALKKEEEIKASDPERQIILKSDKKHQLMTQQLKRLNITLSKVNKKDFEEMIYCLRDYYPEDQTRIILHGLKKYPYEVVRNIPWRAFIENYKKPVSDIDMLRQLFRSMDNFIDMFKIDMFLPNATLSDFIDWLSDWYLSCEGATDEGLRGVKVRLYRCFSNRNINKTLYKDHLIARIKQITPYLNKHKNITLKEFLELETTRSVPSGRAKEIDYSPELKYDLENKTWKVKESKTKVKVTLLEMYMYLFADIVDYHTGLLHSNNQSFLFTDYKTRLPLSEEEIELVKNFIVYGSTIRIDNEFVDYLKSQEDKESGFVFYSHSSIGVHYSDTNALDLFFRLRYHGDQFSSEELKLMFHNKETYEYIYKNVRRSHSFSSDHLLNFIFKSNFRRILSHFDFSKSEELKHFFNLPFNITWLCAKSEGVINDKPDILFKKLKKENPHEVSLMMEFFENQEEVTYNDFVIYDGYKSLTDFEKLLLLNHGVKIGEEREGFGVKFKSDHGKEEILSGKEVQLRMLFDYFKENSNESKHNFWYH